MSELSMQQAWNAIRDISRIPLWNESILSKLHYMAIDENYRVDDKGIIEVLHSKGLVAKAEGPITVADVVGGKDGVVSQLIKQAYQAHYNGDLNFVTPHALLAKASKIDAAEREI